MAYKLSDIARAIDAELLGDGELEISSVASPEHANVHDIALAMDPKYAADLPKGNARCAMLWPGADWQGMGLQAALVAPRPRYALSALSATVDRGQGYALGIHETAVIDPTAQIGANATIGPLSVIGANVIIGNDAIIGPQCTIGTGSVIGYKVYLREGVRIGADVIIGDNFIAQPGATVGADGFSFVTKEVSAVEVARDSLGTADIESSGQQWARIHSLAGVVIGDDVELGAQCCVDRGTVKPTKIGNGVKTDNLSQIGHNVVIGSNCLICAQVGIAGSSVIGNNVVLGGQTGVSDNIFIGDNVITGGATKVLSNVPAGRVMLGYPAMKMETHIETYKALRRLPRLIRDVASLQKGILKSPKND